MLSTSEYWALLLYKPLINSEFTDAPFSSRVASCHDLCQWKLFERLSPLLLLESSCTAAAPPHEVSTTGELLFRKKQKQPFHILFWFLKVSVTRLCLAPAKAEAHSALTLCSLVSLEVLQEVLQCQCYSVLWSLSSSSETLTCRVSGTPLIVSH